MSCLSAQMGGRTFLMRCPAVGRALEMVAKRQPPLGALRLRRAAPLAQTGRAADS